MEQARRDGLITRNPFGPDVLKVTSGETRINPLRSWSEVERVAEAAGFYGPFIRFAAATGLRPGELVALQWGDLDLEARRGEVRRAVKMDGLLGPPKTKTGKRVFVLSKRALGALRDWQEVPGFPEQWVFANRDGERIDWRSFRQVDWYKALTKAGLAKRGANQLRHTFATLSLASGVGIDLVAWQLGHSSIEITSRHYAAWLPARADLLERQLNA